MNTNSTQQRLAYVDIFKGIGILFMVAGHVGYIGVALLNIPFPVYGVVGNLGKSV